MAKKTSTGKTIFKIACATGGAVLASGVGLPWLGAMAGSCLPEMLEGSLDILVSAIKDNDKKKEVLASLLQKPIEQLASLGIEFTGGRIDDFFKSHFEAKESELNFDLPRVVVKVWEEALNKMLPTKREKSLNILNYDYVREELLILWQQKLKKAQTDNDLLKELFGEKPDYFLDVEKGKVSFIDVLPDQKEVENFFWNRIEDSFTNWAKNEEKFPEDWTNSIRQDLKDELRQNLFHDFSSALKKELKKNERAWKSFEFASSLQTVSMLQSLASNIDQIKDDTTNIKQDLIDLIQSLPLMMDIILKRFNNLDRQLKDLLTSNKIITELLTDFRKEVSEKLLKIDQTTRRTDETTQRTEGKVGEIAKDVKTLLGKRDEEELPKIPDDVQTLIDEGLELRNLSKYEEARKAFQKALELATNKGDRFAITEAKRYLAVILQEWDKNPEATKTLLEECLKEFKELKAERSIAVTLGQLGSLEADFGNLDQAEAYLSQALKQNEKNGNELHIASASQDLGRIKRERGNYQEAIDFEDKALKIYLSLYQSHSDSKWHKDLLLWISECYRNKGLAYRKLGKVEEEEANYVLALEWRRKTGYQRLIGEILLPLADLKFREGQYEQGTQFLNEATEISKAIEDDSFFGECLYLKGRLFYRSREIDKAISIFESVLDFEVKAEEFTKQVASLIELGRIYLEDKHQPEQAKDYFKRAKDLSLREDFLEKSATALERLSDIAQIEKNYEERNKLILDGILNLDKLLLTTESKPKRAEIIGRIGVLHSRMENFQQALIYLKRAQKSFKEIADINGSARCLRAIAQINGILGKIGDEFNAYREMKNLVNDTPHYQLIVEATISLAEINIQIGNLDEAKTRLQEADDLNQKHKLQYTKRIEFTLKKLNNQISIRKVSELSFEQLIEELFELVDWFPEEKDSLLRFWITYRMAEIQANVRNVSGVKLMFCQDNVAEFLKTSQKLKPYSDLCLQVATVKSTAPVPDSAPFPRDKEFPLEFAIPLVRADGNVEYLQGNADSAFLVTSSVVHSEITGNEGAVIIFTSLEVPDQAHQLILSSTADELNKQKIFYFPYPRYSFNDKFFADIVNSKNFGLIPTYFDSLPSSEKVFVLYSTKIELPILSDEDVQNQRRQIRKVKQALTQLVSDKNSRQSALNDFVFEVEELKDGCESSESMQIQVYVLEFPSGLEKETHIAFVIKN